MEVKYLNNAVKTLHNKNKFYIVKVLELGFFKEIHYLLSSFILFGLIPFIIILYMSFVTNRLEIVFRIENWPTFFALSWLSFGPAIIKYGDELIIPKYFTNLKSILKMSESEFNNFYDQFDNSFHNNHLYFSIFLSLGVLIMGFVSSNYLEYYWNAISVFEPLSFFILLLLTLTLFLSGIGFCGIYYSIFFITKILKNEGYNLDSFSLDGRGGVKFFGEFYIKTTMIFSTGSFVIPAGIQYMAFSNSSVSYIGYILLILFTFFVALSFIIPIVAIKNISSIEKEQIYNSMLRKYNNILSTYITNDNADENIFENVASGINLLVIQEDIKRMNDMKVWPVDIGIATQLVSSIALPLLVGYINNILITL